MTLINKYKLFLHINKHLQFKPFNKLFSFSAVLRYSGKNYIYILLKTYYLIILTKNINESWYYVVYKQLLISTFYVSNVHKIKINYFMVI